MTPHHSGEPMPQSELIERCCDGNSVKIEPWMRPIAKLARKRIAELLDTDPFAGWDVWEQRVTNDIATAYAAREQDGELRRAAQALIEKVEAAQSFGREIAVLKSALAGETMNELERVVRDCEHCTFYGPEKLWRLKPICWNDTVRSMASSHVTPRKDFYCNQFQPRSLTDERTDRE